MLRRLLATGVSACAAAALQAAVGSSASAATLGDVAGVAPAPTQTAATATTTATTRLLPEIQRSPSAGQRHDSAGGGRGGSGELGASGSGVDADPFGTCISCTGAGAGSNSASSDSQGLHLADESVAEGQSPANGYASGEIIAAPTNPLLGLVIGSYATRNHATQEASEAHSTATFATLTLADGELATVAIFDARSDATYTGSRSRGRAATDGVTANAGKGKLVLILLHSDADSEGPGHAYVAQVNDNEIMSSRELSGGVPITIPKVASIALLSVGPNGAVVGGVNDGKSQQAAGLVTSYAGGDRRRPS